MMREALLLAQEAAAEGEVPVGCVITLDDRIVGRGRNRRETNRTALAHAEIEAIAEACRTLGGWRLWQCTLYVTLEPCPMCAGAILNAHLPRVVYGAKDPNPVRPGVWSMCCICRAAFSRRCWAGSWKKPARRRCATFSARCARGTDEIIGSQRSASRTGAGKKRMVLYAISDHV